MSNEKKNDDGKKSAWAKLLEPETLKQIAAVIGAIAGVITVVGTTVVLVCEKTSLCEPQPSASAVSPTASPPAPPALSPTASHTPPPALSPTASHTPPPTVYPTATCVLSVDSQLSSAWDRRLGCPISEPRIVWAAWQPFERGYMLWRTDTRRVAVFYGNQTWTEFTDQWTEGAPIPSRGTPPPGLLAPIRGFGYIWGTYDSVYDGIGWALEQEKRFCARTQLFEAGFILGTSTGLSCKDDDRIMTTDSSFPPLLFAVYGDHEWQGQ